jgi:hypothetical protein
MHTFLPIQDMMLVEENIVTRSVNAEVLISLIPLSRLEGKQPVVSVTCGLVIRRLILKDLIIPNGNRWAIKGIYQKGSDPQPSDYWWNVGDINGHYEVDRNSGMIRVDIYQHER